MTNEQWTIASAVKMYLFAVVITLKESNAQEEILIILIRLREDRSYKLIKIKKSNFSSISNTIK